MNALAVEVAASRRTRCAQPELQSLVDSVFGADQDSVDLVLQRARQRMPGRKGVVREADPLTFSFTFFRPEARDPST